jgi:hypothetical protein
MARGDGPRLIVDVGVDLKRRFHSRLAADGLTVKGWVTERIETYLGRTQLALTLAEGGTPPAAAGRWPRRLEEEAATYTSEAPRAANRARRKGQTARSKRA